jgi:lipoprotein-anchoring transpeptidase ErfK/SrfK
VRTPCALSWLVVAAALAATTSCGGSPPVRTRAAAPPATVIATATSADLPVFAHAGDASPQEHLTRRTGYGSPRVVDVVGQRGSWLLVLLPSRPLGSTGWVRAGDVRLSRTTYRVEVSLARRTMTLYDGSRVVLHGPAAVGAAQTPTPVGRFFVTDLVRVGRTQPWYGPYALGLSGYSPTLTSFAGGDGQVALHGTDHPETVGRAVSHGCVRLSNPTIAALAKVLPLGAPVFVVA